MTRHEEDIKSPLLDPVPRDTAALLSKLSDQGSTGWKQDALERFLALGTHRDVLSDVQKHVRLDERLCGSHRVRQIGDVE